MLSAVMRNTEIDIERAADIIESNVLTESSFVRYLTIDVSILFTLTRRHKIIVTLAPIGCHLQRRSHPTRFRIAQTGPGRGYIRQRPCRAYVVLQKGFENGRRGRRWVTRDKSTGDINPNLVGSSHEQQWGLPSSRTLRTA